MDIQVKRGSFFRKACLPVPRMFQGKARSFKGSKLSLLTGANRDEQSWAARMVIFPTRWWAKGRNWFGVVLTGQLSLDMFSRWIVFLFTMLKHHQTIFYHFFNHNWFTLRIQISPKKGNSPIILVFSEGIAFLNPRVPGSGFLGLEHQSDHRWSPNLTVFSRCEKKQCYYWWFRHLLT